MTVLLARHGETPWNREGRVQGRAPTPLTERGREAASTAELDARNYSLTEVDDRLVRENDTGILPEV